jgi:hypothetical protein
MPVRRRALALRAALAASVAGALALTPTRAEAQITKDECVDANTKAQSLRRDGKLTAARDELRKCADPTCPGIVLDDCTRRLDEIDRIQPTIVFDAKDGAGGDLVAVQVSVDGRALTDKLTGSSVGVDPGEHVFTFVVAGQPKVERTLVLKEGEKDRRERIVIGAPPAPAPASPVAPGPPAAVPATTSSRMGAQKIAALAVTGGGVLGAAVGGIFGLLAASAWSDQRAACGSPAACPNHAAALSDHSTLSTDATLSTALFIVGGVLVAGGIALFVTGHDEGAPAPTVTSLRLAPSVTAGGAGALLTGRF